MRRLYTLLLIVGFLLGIKSVLSAQVPSKAIGGHEDWKIGDPHTATWARIDSLTRINQAEAAEHLVDSIYALSKLNRDPIQYVKAVLRQQQYIMASEEEGLMLAFNQLDTQIDEAPFIAKQILLLRLADYNRLLESNYFSIDLYSFSRRAMVRSFQFYDDALKDEQIKSVPITTIRVLFDSLDWASYPENATLYDYLIGEKLNCLSADLLPNSMYDIGNKNIYIAPEAFASAEAFAAYTFVKDDKDDDFYRNVQFLQALTKSCLNSPNIRVRSKLDLCRMVYFYNYMDIPNKGTLYLAAIQREMERYKQEGIYPEWAYLLAKYYYTLGQQYEGWAHITAYKLEWQKAYEIVDKMITQYPNSKSKGLANCKALKAILEQTALDVETENMYPLNTPILALVTYRNAPVLYNRLYYVRESKEMLSLRPFYYNHDGNRNTQIMHVRQSLIASLPLVESWEMHPSGNEDHRVHNAEFKVNAQSKAGHYILATSTDPNFEVGSLITYASFDVSNIAYSYCNTKEHLAFRVFDYMSGMPLSQVKAELYERGEYEAYLNKNKAIQSYVKRTHQDGRLDFKGDGDSDNSFFEEFAIRLSKGKDYLHFHDQDLELSHPYDGEFSEIFFLLDRSIYRPGQTVYFKGMVTTRSNQDYKVVPNKTHRVVLLNGNEEIARVEVMTNDYGTFHGEFVLPHIVVGANMGIAIKEEDRYRFEAYFKVEEYKRPSFEVAYEANNEPHKINQRIKIKGSARALAGSAIDGARVSYEIYRRAELPYISWLNWKGKYPDLSNSPRLSGETLTQADGTFEFDFLALPDTAIKQSWRPVYKYTIDLHITSVSGETRSAYYEVRAAYISTLIDVDLGNIQEASTLNKVKIKTSNLDGVFIPAQGQLVVEEIVSTSQVFKERIWRNVSIDQTTMTEEAFRASFPNVAYQEEDKLSKWKVKRLAFTSRFDTAKDSFIYLNTNQRFASGVYRMTLTSIDPSGDTLKRIRYCSFYDLSKQTMPADKPLLLVTDKTVYEPGETAIIYIGSSFEEGYAFYNLEHEGKFLVQGCIKVNGIGQISIPILESYRGSLHFNVSLTKHARTYQSIANITVPFTNKALTIEYSTFRNKLSPGQEEEWRIKISGAKKEAVLAEVLANMYDASLDNFKQQAWVYPQYKYDERYPDWDYKHEVKGETFSFYVSEKPYIKGDNYHYPSIRTYDMYAVLNKTARKYGKDFKYHEIEGIVELHSVDIESICISATSAMAGQYSRAYSLTEDPANTLEDNVPEPKGFDNVKVRTNLNETVFFKPDLMTDKDGNIIIKFKMNEALTRWRLMLLAVTKDLNIGYSERFVVTQKDLMVTPNAPRFLRENDLIEFSAKVDNMTEAELKGEAKLELYDALTMQPIDSLLGNTQAVISFDAKAKQSAALRWQLKLPDGGLSAVTYRVLVKAGDFSDGEENTLPVISDRMFLTETLPLSVRGSQSKTFNFKRMTEVTQSKTAKGEKLTLEFTSNPTWLAIQSMGYLMQYPHECTEQLFSRFYGNALAYSIIATHPKIKQVFDTWKKDGAESFTSNLLKNPELQLALIEETPWVLASKNQEIQKKQLALLFDLGLMADQIAVTLNTISERQNSQGGFSWYPQMGADFYITAHIIEGFGRLNRLMPNVFVDYPESKKLISQALQYADNIMLSQYKTVTATNYLGTNPLNWELLKYIYARSFYLSDTEGRLYLPLKAEYKTAYEFYINEAAAYSKQRGAYANAMAAIALYRSNKIEAAKAIVDEFRQQAIIDEDSGMHWSYESGYYWYQSNIEAHVLMLEVFDEVAKDTQAVDGIKTYLLKSRQGASWHTTKSTSAAIYALLLRGDDWLEEDKDIKITLGNTVLDKSKIKKEAGTGYFKTSWNAAEVKPEMANITVENPNKNIAWGAMYWQYFEDYDKVTSFRETPLKLSKQLYRRVNTDNGVDYKLVTDTTVLHVGDWVEVRISLEATQDMEYVHLKDMRAACFEPLNVLSKYKYQSGIDYYESTHDLNTSFFIGALHKGKYQFSYPLRVTHRGNFSNGVSIIQSMYAPEFTSHSEGMRVTVK